MRQVAALAVLGCIAALSSGCGAIGGTGGQVVSYQGYGGTAIVSTGGRTITVGQFGSGSCGATVKAVARESATRVALFLRFSTPRNPPPCPNTAASRITSQKIRLRAPLGSRKIVDGRNGRATAWISARLVLRPARLPRGSARRADPGGGPGSGAKPGPGRMHAVLPVAEQSQLAGNHPDRG